VPAHINQWSRTIHMNYVQGVDTHSNLDIYIYIHHNLAWDSYVRVLLARQWTTATASSSRPSVSSNKAAPFLRAPPTFSLAQPSRENGGYYTCNANLHVPEMRLVREDLACSPIIETIQLNRFPLSLLKLKFYLSFVDIKNQNIIELQTQ